MQTKGGDEHEPKEEAGARAAGAGDGGDRGRGGSWAAPRAARLSGKSESRLRRLELTDLPPVVENGIHRHSIRKLFEYKVEHLSVTPQEQGFDGTIAAAAFELFDQGLGPADVVRSLRIDPRLARDLHREWADLRGSIVIGGQAMVELQQIWWLNDELDGEGELRSGEDLVRVLETHSTQACIGCKRRAARLCAWCFVYRNERTEDAAKEAIRAAEASADVSRR
jgi:hypothetical protein